MDSIHPFVVKRCASTFSDVFSAIFTRLFPSGKNPEALRLAQISPIFKKGIRSAPGSYRPISLTSVPCKLMERMIRDISHLVKFFADDSKLIAVMRSCCDLSALQHDLDALTERSNT